MESETEGAAEAALIEQVILALANMRAALEWFAEPGDGRRMVGLERLDLQLEEVEDAAWRVLAALQRKAQAEAQAMPTPMFISRRA